MESDKMIEISEADFPELPEIAALEREIFPDAWSLKSLEETWKQKITRIMLEVRENNEAARQFYGKCGFTKDGIRRNYYESPKENAVLMSVNL